MRSFLGGSTLAFCLFLFCETIATADQTSFPIRVEISENGIPTEDVWPKGSPKATEEYAADVFGFFHVPHKYIDTGIRGERSNPFLLRASATVTFPAGKHRVLLRGRGASRLRIDGKEILTLPFRPKPVDGHNSISTDYLDLGPDFRFAPPGNREKWTTFLSTGQPMRIELETIIGALKGKARLRPELGETVVAWSPEGTEIFFLVSPQRKILYTDAGWADYEKQEAARLFTMERQRRAAALARESAFWKSRRDHAHRWLAATDDVKVPPLAKGYPAHNAIDHFLAVKLTEAERARSELGKGIDFHAKVKPILDAKCLQCHQGKKAKGGLRLDTRMGLIAGGDSEEPILDQKSPEKSELLRRVLSAEADRRMPPQGDPLSATEVAVFKRWIEEGAVWPSVSVRDFRVTELTTDLDFLRRVTLDTVGTIPTSEEVDRFLADRSDQKRARVIDRLLADDRWADHWVGYWQDVLAENPNILNPTLNNSGPFRWWIYESLLDNKPWDLMVTELVRMRGSLHQGGPAGFAMASENDVPLAEKGIILASAFQGVQMRCARCHDAPAHQSTQRDLFEIASMLNEGPLTVPKTSSVPADKLHGLGRKPLITVTLNPGSKVTPAWPFKHFLAEPVAKEIVGPSTNSRDRLAALLTSPENERFAQVMVNRVWQRLMGRGIVEPVDDWEKSEPSHPELLRYLAREFVRSGYNLKAVARLVLRSHAYQRANDPDLKEPTPLFASPARRRLSGEQIVDSMFLAAGKAMDTEEVSLDIDGGRDMKSSISLGKPRRAWQLASTSNERDRPSLSLPRVQAVVDVLEAFGWRGARQDPLTVRDESPNVLQPAILANGTMNVWLTRLSEDHGWVSLAIEKQPVEALANKLFLKVFTRTPTTEEQAALVALLKPGFDQRIIENPPPPVRPKRSIPKYVSWSNHLSPEANEIKVQLDLAARRGDPPTTRLEPVWRERLEDVLWSLLNSPEFVFRP